MQKRTTIQCGQEVADKLRQYEIVFGKNRDEMLEYLMNAIKPEFIGKMKAQIASMEAMANPIPSAAAPSN